jgi:hypothetical protein
MEETHFLVLFFVFGFGFGFFAEEVSSKTVGPDMVRPEKSIPKHLQLKMKCLISIYFLGISLCKCFLNNLVQQKDICHSIINDLVSAKFGKKFSLKV